MNLDLLDQRRPKTKNPLFEQKAYFLKKLGRYHKNNKTPAKANGL